MQRSLRLLPALLLVGALCAASPALAQRQISGVVTDSLTNETLPGAAVTVPGTTVGAATDIDGAYSLEVPATADSLRFSYIGYEPQTVAIAGRSVVDVALSQAAQTLENLVVIGYGEVEEEDLTGAVERITPEDFNTAAAVSPEQILAGKIAGVQVTSNDGAPGADNQIRIRGATSVNASSDPLFVIDGVPISNEGVQGSRNPLNFLNPNDIASVTVLKDASSTAIYGSRGANGVILIETKSGAGTEAEIVYNGEALVSSVTDRIAVLDAARFREAVAAQAPQMLPMLGVAETDWQDAIERPGYGQRHDISFSRGFDDADVRFSLNYLNQDGTLYASSTERVAAALTYNQRLFDDALSIRTSLRGARTEDEFEAGIVGGAASFDPTQPIRLVGSPFGGFYEWDAGLAENNPVAEFILTENVGTTYRTLGSAEAAYEVPFVDGLTLRSVLGFDLTTGEREFFAPTFLKGQAEGANPGRIERRSYTQSNLLADLFANYGRDLDALDSEFDVTVGYSYQDFYEEYPEVYGSGLTTNIFGRNSFDAVGDPANITAFVTEIPSRLISAFGRVNYQLLDRYLLTATVRQDGSSRFGRNNQYGTFPSAAFAWRIDEEPFFPQNRVVSSLKLRASWGVTGNQDIDDFLYAPFYRPGGPQAQIQFGDRFISTIRPGPADEDIKWEETTSTNLGFDYGLLDGRVTGEFNVYASDTDDLLFNVPVAAGANLSDFVTTNIGSVRNEGLEFGLNAFVVDTDAFSYSAQFNASTNRNELLSIDRDVEDVITIDTGGISGGVGNTVQVLREGEPVNSFFLYEHVLDDAGNPVYADVDGDGLINEQDLYRDVNGDGVINEDDRVVRGNPAPDWVLGHTSQFRAGSADFSVTLRAQLGAEVYNNVASNFGYYNRLTEIVPSNLHESVLETGFVDPQYFSDVYLEDGSFLRVDNVALGYTLETVPGVGRVRVYGSVSNALLLTGYSGPDPEIGVSGIDNNLYPRARTFRLGTEVRF
jgi:iron complex outermembrane receptor protein